MSSKLNLSVRNAYLRGGAAWGCLRVKADMVLFAGDPYLSALEAFAKTRYTNRRYLYLYLLFPLCYNHVNTIIKCRWGEMLGQLLRISLPPVELYGWLFMFGYGMCMYKIYTETCDRQCKRLITMIHVLVCSRKHCYVGLVVMWAPLWAWRWLSRPTVVEWYKSHDRDTDFYSSAALLVIQSAVLATSIPSVRPSVTRWYCTQTNEDIFPIKL